MTSSVKATVKRKSIIMEYAGPWIVKITYFKASGKYYSEGEYTSSKLALYEIWHELYEMFAEGTRPGLVDGTNEFYALVEVPEHPHNHPYLIIPEKVEGTISYD